MFKKQTIPVLLLVLAVGLFVAFTTTGLGRRKPVNKYERILLNVGMMLKEIHYSPKKVNDEFSREIFKRYMSEMDPEKTILLKPDIQSLKKFENQIDDEINGELPVQFFLNVAGVFNKRVEEIALVCKDLLTKPFSFDTDESYVADPDKIEFATSADARREVWRKKVKLMVLEKFADLQDTREKDKLKPGYTPRSDADLEKEAREKVQKVLDKLFDRYRNKFTEDEKFNLFVNTITSTFDPHSDYFPPVEKRSFEESMSGRFYGIGASLSEDDNGNIKIGSLFTGSPAWKSGELAIGDVILKVAQGKDEPVDLTGYETQDAVKLIRGKKGTEVRLTIRKSDGTIKIITLIRDEIVLEDTFARSFIIKGKNRIGYIFLPEFYADWERSNGNRCSEDVAKEIRKLKEQKVDGLVIDLRNNGGGSLYEVVQMAGLFIEDGPIVQVKEREGKPSVLRDKDRNVLYEGPLTVMVNEFSASASEIFAAAIQDYNRGVIIGSTSTYGKGTVQRNIGLEKTLDPTSPSEMGSIKLTLQKFYRINGGSTQLRGVVPDIVLPDLYEYSKIREKDQATALRWDEVEKANYTPWKSGFNMAMLKNSSQARIKDNQAFNIIRTNSEWLAKQNDKVYQLQLKKYREEQRAIQASIKQIETLNKLNPVLEFELLAADKERLDQDKDRQTRINAWMKRLSDDIYLNESVNVLNDLIDQSNMAKK